MIKVYRKWLVRKNETTGKKSWWLVFGTGVIIILAWIFAVLPQIGIAVGIHVIGDSVRLPTGQLYMVAYNLWFIPDPVASYYILLTFFSVPVAKFGLLIAELGYNYGIGLRYYMPCPGYPWGYWQ